MSKSHASLPFLETARLGHEDSLVATLKRSRNAMRRLGLDRMLAGKARSIAEMPWERPRSNSARTRTSVQNKLASSSACLMCLTLVRYAVV